MEKYNQLKQFETKKPKTIEDLNFKVNFEKLGNKSTAEYLMNFAFTNNKIFSIQQRVVSKTLSDENTQVFDIKFAGKFLEDKTYKDRKDVQEVIRRGNTVLKKSCLLAVIRRGLNKFFDYTLSFSSNNAFSRLKEVVVGSVISRFKENELLNNEETFQKSIVVYRMYKANGENLQISYSDLIDSWIICSKNVALPIKNWEEWNEINSNSIGKDELTFCLYFSNKWLKMLDELETKESGLVQKLKDRLNGYTLIGESVGDPNHQHIKLYSSAEFQFYAIVNNNLLQQPCINIEETIDFLSSFGLKMVDYEKSEDLLSLDQFYDYMKNIYLKVLFSSIEEEGEGNVCYFTLHDKKANSFEVLSLAKLKTFEYRFIRKLREKLKGFTQESGINTTISTITRESFDILDDKFESIYDISSYISFAGFILSYVKKNEIKINFEQYGSFIEKAKEEFRKTYPNHELKIIIKNEENQKNKYDNVDYDEDINLIRKQKETENCNIKKLSFDKPYLILSYGIVGGGKSTLYKNLSKLVLEKFNTKIDLKQVSSDEIMAKEIELLKEYNPNIKSTDAFEKCRGKVKNKFEQEVKTILESYNPKDKKYLFVYLDKNFPLREINKGFGFMRDHPYSLILFYPSITNTLDFVPFSLNYINQCYGRVMKREHLTLDSNNKEFYFVLFSFLALNRGKPSDITLGSGTRLPISMTDESEQLNYKESEYVVNALRSIVNMKDKLLFNNKMIDLEFNKEIKLVIDYFDSKLQNHTFSSTEELVLKELEQRK